MGFFNVLWISTGYTGAPGYTKFHFFASNVTQPTQADVNAAAANSRPVLAATASNMPTGVSYACQTPAQWYDDAGVLLGEVPVTSIPSAVTGTGGASYPGGVGAVVYWATGLFNGGHKIKGRTYLVPLAVGAFAADGTLNTALVTAIQNAATTFVGTSPQPCVNSRKLGQADRSDKTVTVTAATVKDRSAFLRTRRT
jgi:hypothetical protein